MTQLDWGPLALAFPSSSPKQGWRVCYKNDSSPPGCVGVPAWWSSRGVHWNVIREQPSARVTSETRGLLLFAFVSRPWPAQIVWL